MARHALLGYTIRLGFEANFQGIIVMALGGWKRGVMILAVAATLGGCAHSPPPGRLVYGKCGPDHHTEAYPHNPDPKKAYGCRSDDAGLLESRAQGDKMGN